MGASELNCLNRRGWWDGGLFMYIAILVQLLNSRSNIKMLRQSYILCDQIGGKVRVNG